MMKTKVQGDHESDLIDGSSVKFFSRAYHFHDSITFSCRRRRNTNHSQSGAENEERQYWENKYE